MEQWIDIERSRQKRYSTWVVLEVQKQLQSRLARISNHKKLKEFLSQKEIRLLGTSNQSTSWAKIQAHRDGLADAESAAAIHANFK